MADILVASREGEALTWGAGSDLVAAGGIRQRYLDAIHRADAGDMTALLIFARS